MDGVVSIILVGFEVDENHEIVKNHINFAQNSINDIW